MNRNIAVAVAVLSTLSTAKVAHAQAQAPSTAASPDSTTFEEVVVTAQRREDRLQDVSLSISAVSGKALAQTPVSNLADIQSSVPNVNISPRNSSGVVAIRGIGFDVLTAGAEGSVAIHTDGVYQSRPTGALASLFDVERVEIARGPQGTLYGRNATGGAINIISRRPTSTPEGYLNLSAGNYGAFSAEGAISGPIVGDGIEGRLAAKYDKHDGYGENLYNGKDVDDLETISVRGMLRFTPSSNASFLLVGDYFKRDDAGFAPHFGGCIQVCSPLTATQRGYKTAPDLRDVNLDIQPVNRNELYGLALTSQFDLGFAQLTSISAFREGQSYYIFDLDGTPQPNAFVTREEDHEEVSQELQLSNKGDRFGWVAGVYYFHERNYARANGHFPDFQAPNLVTYFQGGTLRTSAYAAFGEVNWRVVDKVTLTLGARYSDETKTIADEMSYTRSPAFITARQAAPTAKIPCVVCVGLPDSVSFNSFSPKVSLEYRPVDDKMLYLTIQKGFKSGGFANGAVAPAFQPETIWSYEAGLKASWFNRRLITNLAAYHYDYADLQVGQVLGLVSVINNAAKAKVDGVEIETRAKLGGHFELSAQGSYNDARFESYKTANGGVNPNVTLDLAGNSLSNAPKWSGSLALQYRTALAEGDVTLRGELTASSRVYFSPFNDLNNSQAAYSLANLSARYEAPGGRWFVSTYVNNLADKTIKAGSLVTVGAVGSWINLQLLPPRTFGAKVGFNF